MRLRSITGYTTYEVEQKDDRELSISPNPAGQLVLSQDSKAFSQELTLSALDAGAFDWRVGLYYTQSKGTENRQGESIKDIWLYPLRRDFAAVLCR